MNATLIRTLAATLLAVAFSAAGDVPRTLSYQGYLTNAAGQPFANGTTQVFFKLYNVATGGSHLWLESQNVQVTNGAFSTILGSISPFDPAQVRFDEAYWLEILVNGPAGLEVLSPRQPIAAAPSALFSNRAGGLSPTACAVGSMVRGFGANGAPLCTNTLQLQQASCNAATIGTLQWNPVLGIVEVCDGLSMRSIKPVVTFQSAIPVSTVLPGKIAVLDGTFTYTPRYAGSSLTVWAECVMSGGASVANITLAWGPGASVDFPSLVGLGPSVNGSTYRIGGTVQLQGVMPLSNATFTLGIVIENPALLPNGSDNKQDATCSDVRYRVIETP